MMLNFSYLDNNLKTVLQSNLLTVINLQIWYFFLFDKNLADIKHLIKVNKNNKNKDGDPPNELR